MDKTMTLSFKTNPRQTNIRHNNRELTEKEFRSDAHKHIQREKSKYNIQIVKRDIKDVYHELFDDALNAYNTKQKRKDRKIDDYYKHVQKSKNLDLQREFIVTVGNKSDWERLSFEEKQEVGEALVRYVSDFNDRHSNMTIYNAMADLMRTNDRLTKDLQYVIEDRNKYKYQLQDQEYYLTDQEREEIAEKIIQRKDLELEDGDRDRTFEKDDLDFSR